MFSYFNVRSFADERPTYVPLFFCSPTFFFVLQLIEEYFGSISQAPSKVERSRQHSRERLFASLLEKPERAWDGVRGAARMEHASAPAAPAGDGIASVRRHAYRTLHNVHRTDFVLRLP